MRFFEDPKLMEQEVLHYLPIGSSIENAQTIMEQNGFKCQNRRNSSFVAETSWPKKNSKGEQYILYKNKDFIYCDQSEGFIVLRRWQVSLVYRKGIVTNVFVSTGLIGP